MSRLYDRVFSRGTVSPHGPEEARATRRSLEDAVVVAADDVAEFFFAHEHKGPASWSPAEDIPTLAPPFRSFFVEARMPTRLSAAWGHHLEGWPRALAFGALFEATDLHRLFRQVGHPVPEAAAHTRARDAFRSLGSAPGESRQEIASETEGFHELLASPSGAGARWLLQTELVLEHEGEKKVLTGAFGAYAVIASDGVLCPTREGPGAYKAWTHPSVFASDGRTGALCAEALREASPQDVAGAVGQMTNVYLLPLLLAVSFANCKNVVLEDRDPDEKRSRRHRKKHRRPLVSHKRLLIDPMREVLRREGAVEKAGIRQALHLCRGHFRTYTPERGGPFGRPIEKPYTEWVSPHTRGGNDPGAGVAGKDYEVLPAPSGPAGRSGAVSQ